jgi:hypothetical protein
MLGRAGADRNGGDYESAPRGSGPPDESFAPAGGGGGGGSASDDDLPF